MKSKFAQRVPETHGDCPSVRMNVTNNPADLKKIIKKKKKKKKMRYFAKIGSIEDGAFLILNENIAFKLVNNIFV